jgi:hypothetical protein
MGMVNGNLFNNGIGEQKLWGDEIGASNGVIVTIKVTYFKPLCVNGNSKK